MHEPTTPPPPDDGTLTLSEALAAHPPASPATVDALASGAPRLFAAAVLEGVGDSPEALRGALVANALWAVILHRTCQEAARQGADPEVIGCYGRMAANATAVGTVLGNTPEVRAALEATDGS